MLFQDTDWERLTPNTGVPLNTYAKNKEKKENVILKILEHLKK